MADDVTVELTADRVSATTVVDADPSAVFDFLRRPANHAVISGDHTVRGAIKGPELLAPGSRFGMEMRIKLPYRVTSRVVEFEPDRLIAWCHFFGHRWRWELEPAGPGRTSVRETFDLGTAKIPAALRVIGLPQGHRGNVAKSVRNVANHFRA
ncbi:dimethyladenosine transferase [Kribbella antibiotica]|uniref:Dimethyladenosine transferase n=1 Tax=Kribbella antibiotica TaxID=190195 RepID=A0A4R4Z8A3_9ACTN|nr:SRPBCC family protein [Kribbella antibiotica]TDD54458.1 dimethyladenosine transferase [Kribbella antibiotica]